MCILYDNNFLNFQIVILSKPFNFEKEIVNHLMCWSHLYNVYAVVVFLT